MLQVCQKYAIAYILIKLFDLMIMGVKYQILCCKFPEELLQITYTHLRGLSLLLKSGPELAILNTIEENLKKVSKYKINQIEI